MMYQIINPNRREFLARSGRTMRMETLKNVGFIDGHRVIRSRRDKQQDPRRQRRTWRNELAQ